MIFYTYFGSKKLILKVNIDFFLAILVKINDFAFCSHSGHYIV